MRSRFVLKAGEPVATCVAVPSGSVRMRVLRCFVRAVALAFLAVAGTGPGLLAAELNGRIVAVRDGDTIDVLTSANVRVRVRLAAIDAPEIGQAFGNAARRALSSLAYNQMARVEWSKRDDYDRVVGKLFVHGADVNLQMIERGLAWHYRAYAGEQSAADRKRYAAAEAAARAQKLGLWQDQHPVPPWVFRHSGSVRTSDADRRTKAASPASAHQTG